MPPIAGNPRVLDHVPLALGELNPLTTLLERDHLAEQYLQTRTIAPQGLHCRKQAWHLALVVRAEVNESFIRRIRPGMTASVLLDADPQAPVIPAKVERLGQILVQAHLNTDQQEQMSRVVECILQFQQPHDLLIGQNVLVKFHD